MIFFNCSLPRSGSELMQQVLHQNPDIYATRTDGFLELIYGARANFTTLPEFQSQDQALMNEAFNGFALNGLKGWSESLKGSREHICLKSRGINHWYEWFQTFTNAKPKVIVMVRDLRAIISSLEKLYRKNRNYATDVDRPSLMKGITVGQRVDEWFNGPPLGLALKRLYGIFERKLEGNLLFVNFENFTKNPQEAMSQVYDYLDLPPYEHDFKNLPELSSEQSSLYGPFGNHTLRKEIAPMKPDHFEILGKEICSRIVENNRWFYNQFYPEKI